MDLALRYWSIARFNSRATPLQKIFVLCSIVSIFGILALGMGGWFLSGLLILSTYLTYLIVWYKNK